VRARDELTPYISLSCRSILNEREERWEKKGEKKGERGKKKKKKNSQRMHNPTFLPASRLILNGREGREGKRRGRRSPPFS